MNSNMLVQYSGGGYDGCIMEWNFFYIDKDGVFHDIFSSGCAGIHNQQQAQDLFDQDTDDVFTYDLADDKAIEEFSRDCNPVNVAGVLRWFDDYNSPDAEFFVLCSKCEKKITEYNELVLESWHGCGGVMSTADLLLCSECYTLGTCGCCDEYMGPEELIWLGGEYSFDDDYMDKGARKLLDDGYTDVCEGCIGEQARQLEEEEHGDLLWASMTTGNPDLFSPEMSWYWGVENEVICGGLQTQG